MFGEVPAGQALLRSGAQVGDDIWVSGSLGDARIALDALLRQHALPAPVLAQARQRLEQPTPRVALGQALRAGRALPFPEVEPRASSLARERRGHCPYGHGLPDAALDRFVLDAADDMGVAGVAVRTAGGGEDRFRAALAAHAGNGGAVVDDMARTTVPGLFAAGECATGMHGANRLGGAMVAACLVFGARAGRAAATATDGDIPGGRTFRDAVARSMHDYCRDLPERQEMRRFLAGTLTRRGLPRKRTPDPALAGILAERRIGVADTAAARMLGSTLAFAAGQG